MVDPNDMTWSTFDVSILTQRQADRQWQYYNLWSHVDGIK